MHRRNLLAAGVVSGLLIAGLSSTPAHAESLTAFAVYMAPNGSDTNSGTASAPVRTLARVQQIIETAAGGANRDLGQPVEVRVKPGTYADTQHLTWRYFSDNYLTRFLPWDYQDGWAWPQVSAAGGRPVFDGQWRPGYGFYFVPGRTSTTGNTNLDFVYLEFRRYIKGGIHIGGQTYQTSGGQTVWGPQAANGNRFYGNYFTLLGDYKSPDPGAPEFGYAGIGLANSRRNVVQNNHFVDLRNANPYPGQIHALYLSHGSAWNQILGNRYDTISGDGIRFRNGASANVVDGGSFTYTGEYGYLSDWYRPKSYYDSGVYDTWEVASYNNVGRNLTFVSPDPNHKPQFCRAFVFDLNRCAPADRISIQ